MKKVIIVLCACIVIISCNSGDEATTLSAGSDSADTAKNKSPQAEFADPKYVEMGKAFMTKFAAGDIDGYAEALSDNIVYDWSGGDSLVGKQAVINYWKERRANVVDSVSISNDIWLPIKVNTPQKGPDMPGNWLISWHQVTAKYRSGKTISFWVHIDYHFDSNDKVDRQITYMDMAKVQAAMSK